ncbi:hypothetical protein BU24DRAFT_323490, partial [Aaosphaeria arxii CBS 175.79]
MSTDKYLTLCLEQAELSPLHYRHGCVIVRGGKVIGKGYNDYRSGFDGGALKTGRLPTRSDGPAALKLKANIKLKHKAKDITSDSKDSTGNRFIAFEGMSGGNLASTPFSMHSEIMAIQSALSSPSTMSLIKPYSKLSGGTKGSVRTRRDAIKAYVEQVCAAAVARSITEKHLLPPSVQECVLNNGHLDQTDMDLGQLQSVGLLKDMASDQRDHQDDHGLKNEKKEMKTTRSERQIGPGQREHSRCGITTPCHFQSVDASKAKKALPSSQPKGEDGLVPTRSSGRRSSNVAQRTTDPKLHGVDLYVARLGRKTISSSTMTSHCCSNKLEGKEQTLAPWSDPDQLNGSLHDEYLSYHQRSKHENTTSTAKLPDQKPSMLSSRPCYRCISYIDAVGIKRVFWTTEAGTWEGAKVRDLVEAWNNGG